MLEKELNYLRAKDIIVDGYFQFRDIRNDGWPKSTARPSQPGVILSFNTKRGRMSMPCDTYTDWEANLRAIALTLESLRTIERYGVTSDQQEQYTGWLKLPQASVADELHEHAKTLHQFAERSGDIREVVANQTIFESVWKVAAQKTHPDVIGGTGEKFRQVITARVFAGDGSAGLLRQSRVRCERGD